MDFGAKFLWCINIGGVDVWITETIVNTWVIMAILIVFAIVVRLSMRNFKAVPTGLQNVAEMIVGTFDGLVRSSAGEGFMSLAYWYFAVFALVLLSNLSGLVGARPPTGDFATAFGLALGTFALIQFYAIKRRGLGYLKGFIEPYPFFLPLNIIGELARPVSLSFRLFGNVLSGIILMTLVYALAPIALRFVVPAALHAYFDLFSGVLQTYIFCVLGLTFVGDAASEDG